MIRHYRTWVQEGDNRFRYKHYNNPLHRLSAAGFHEFGGAEAILYFKKDVVEYISNEPNSDGLEFVYCEYGSCYKQYVIYAKKLREPTVP